MPRFEEHPIKLSDGYSAYARYWPAESGRGTVLYLHGIQSHCGWYEASAGLLQEAGYAVLQPDRRGSGRNSQDRGHAEDHNQLIDDVNVCLQYLETLTQQDRHHVLGISWGGKLATAAYVVNPLPIRSLILVCPGLFPRVDVSNAEKCRIGLSMLGDRRKLFDIPLNDPALFTSDPKWVDFLANDPLTLHQATASFFLAGRRLETLIKKIPKTPSTPLHLMVSNEDRIIDTPRTERFVRELDWPVTRITHYDTAYHTLEFEPLRDVYFADLLDWLGDVSQLE